MKKLKALICKWFGHRWVEDIQGNLTITYCKRCNDFGGFMQVLTIKKVDYTDHESQHLKDYLKVLKGGKQ